MSTAINWLFEILAQVLSWVVNLLPNSPFTAISNTPIAPYLGFINWFIPFDFVITTLTLWLSAIAIYYVYSVILRWVKAVE